MTLLASYQATTHLQLAKAVCSPGDDSSTIKMGSTNVLGLLQQFPILLHFAVTVSLLLWVFAQPTTTNLWRNDKITSGLFNSFVAEL